MRGSANTSSRPTAAPEHPVTALGGGAKGRPKRVAPPRAPIAWTGVVHPPEMVTRAFITVPELALRAGVPARKAWEWVSAGRVEVVRWGKRTTRIAVAEAERFLAAGGW
jgi:hypothetical protein